MTEYPTNTNCPMLHFEDGPITRLMLHPRLVSLLEEMGEPSAIKRRGRGWRLEWNTALPTETYDIPPSALFWGCNGTLLRVALQPNTTSKKVL